MTDKAFEMLFKHNNWANAQIIDICSTLTDTQLDAEPTSATAGSIRKTLTHVVAAQVGYLRLLTVPLEERLERPPLPPFSDLRELAIKSGEGLLALATSGSDLALKDQIQTRDNYLVEPWVILLQVINHATEHREQIKSMLTALGVTPPEIDGWSYGDFTRGIIPSEKNK